VYLGDTEHAAKRTTPDRIIAIRNFEYLFEKSGFIMNVQLSQVLISLPFGKNQAHKSYYTIKISRQVKKVSQELLHSE